MKVGYIGVGNMGGGMTKNLIEAGFEVTINDLSEEAGKRFLEMGAKWASTPAEVAASSDVVFTSLPGPPVVQKVVYDAGGLAEGLKAGSVYVDMTTSSPNLIRDVADDLGEKGVSVLDAAVSGLPPDAEAGNLAIFAGGDKSSFERVEPCFRAMGPRVSHMGALGSGMATKIVHNMMSFGIISVLVEGFTLGKKAGVDIDALYKAVEGGLIGRGEVLKILPARIFPGNFEIDGAYGMPLSYARKDVRLATELGRSLDVPLLISTLVEQDMTQCIAEGAGDKATPYFVTPQERRAQVFLRNQEES